MDLKKISIVISLVFLIGFASSQITGGFTIPPTFTVTPSFNNLPIPVQGDKIFGCPYDSSIGLRDSDIYSTEVIGGQVNLDMSFSLYTNNRRSACSVERQIISCPIFGWENCISNYITNDVGSSIISEIGLETPISSTGISGNTGTVIGGEI